MEDRAFLQSSWAAMAGAGGRSKEVSQSVSQVVGPKTVVELVDCTVLIQIKVACAWDLLLAGQDTKVQVPVRAFGRRAGLGLAVPRHTRGFARKEETGQKKREGSEWARLVVGGERGTGGTRTLYVPVLGGTRDRPDDGVLRWGWRDDGRSWQRHPRRVDAC